MTTESQRRILVLGASGFIGQHLLAYIGPDRALGTYFKNPVDNAVYFDVLSMDLLEVVDDPSIFSSAVVLLGATKPDYCVLNPTNSQALNVDALKTSLIRLHEWNIKPIFTSSEMVFDGEKGNYIETDVARSVLKYGQQKLEVEQYIRDNFDKYVILRLATVLGHTKGDGTLLSNWMESIKHGEISLCATDFINTPVSINDVVKSVVGLIDKGSTGTFHVASTTPISRLGLYQTLIKSIPVGKIADGANSQECSIHDFDLPERRPNDVSMNPNKLIDELGITMTSIENICSSIACSALKDE